MTETKPEGTEMREALEKIEQRCNESGTGEMGLLDTIHAVHGIARAALSSTGDERREAIEACARRLESRWKMFADQGRMSMAQTVHEDIEVIRSLLHATRRTLDKGGFG